MMDLKFDMWMNILIHIAENANTNITSLTKGRSYAHTHNLCTKLEEIGLIKLNKQGRLINIELTPNGWAAAKYVKELKRLIEEAKK